VGYSMGGIIAQLLYRRHRTLVSVWCCAPPRAMSWTHQRRSWPPWRCRPRRPPYGGTRFCGWPAARLSGWRCLALWTTRPQPGGGPRPAAPDPLATVSALQAVCGFTSDGWIGKVDVPTAVVVTPWGPHRSGEPPAEAGRAVPGASVHEVDADHAVCITAPEVFARRCPRHAGRWAEAAGQ
jgi:hypothetical protein